MLLNNLENGSNIETMLKTKNGLTEKEQLAIDVLNGGANAVLSAKRLIEIETGELKDGNEKYLSATEVVKRLDIDNLNTLIFHKWLTYNKFGSMKVMEGQKKSYFHPNDKFKNSIAKNGFANTGLTSSGKPKISYNPKILEIFNEKDTKQSLIDFVQRETINPFKNY